MLRALAIGLMAISGLAQAVNYPVVVNGPTLLIPVTPFSNMASGYQATNPGFRAILKDSSGDFVAGGAMTMDAVIKGYSDDASQGSAYGQLVLKVDIEEAANRLAAGNFKGTLSICMAKDANVAVSAATCKSLGGNLHGERPFQWIDKQVDYTVADNGDISITRYHGSTGEGGTSRQLALSVFHPAYGFAAPGKAFKDYQSPLVLDIDRSGTLDLVNVWAKHPVIRTDLNGTGDKVRTGWVKPNDGILFLDDGSGCAANGTRFFGEYTLSKDGSRTYENGFVALADLLDKKKTGRVIAAEHPNLKIWLNKRQDGICHPDEVVPASKHVREISVAYQTHENPGLNEDNEVRLTGHYVGTNGKKYLIGDVWFKQRRNDVAKN